MVGTELLAALLAPVHLYPKPLAEFVDTLAAALFFVLFNYR